MGDSCTVGTSFGRIHRNDIKDSCMLCGFPEDKADAFIQRMKAREKEADKEFDDRELTCVGWPGTDRSGPKNPLFH